MRHPSVLTRGNHNLNLRVTLYWRIFLCTLVLAFAAGIAFGLAPAFQATKVDLAPTLKGIRSETPRRRLFGLGQALVVAQIALSLLLIGAGLFVRNKETPYFLKARADYRVGYSPSKPSASRIDAANDRDGPDDDIGSSHTLTLLVVSIVLDRNALLFSKSLERSRQLASQSQAGHRWLHARG